MPGQLGRGVMRAIRLAIIIVGCFVYAPAQERGAGAAGAGEGETLREILDELRLLREAIQKTNLQTYRAQVTLGRIRVQQERVDRLARQLDGVRTELLGLRHGRERLAERTKAMEERVRAEADEDARAQWANVLKDLQGELRLQADKEQSRLAAEAQLAMQLQTEQSALDELNNQLQRFERDIEGGDAQGGGRKRESRPED